MTLPTFAIVTSSIDPILLLTRMSGREAMTEPFEYRLELLSPTHDIDLASVVGKSMTVKLELPDQQLRYFNGIISRFACVSDNEGDDYAKYTATLRPWSWRLTQSSDCRIYQNMSIPDVIKDVFRRHGFSDFDEALSGNYKTWEYLVQYRESAHAFITRLMEQAGIYYFFKHEEERHLLVLADSYSSHAPAPGYEEVPYFPPTTSADRRKRDHLDSWHIAQEIQPAQYSLTDFNFTTPKADLSARSKADKNLGEFELYDYPGEYEKPDEGPEYTKIRLEQITSDYEIAETQGNARGLGVGSLFTISGLTREALNREYLITSAGYYIDVGLHESGETKSAPAFRCNLVVRNSDVPFRAARVTPKPLIAGPQTATVVGKAGEEIWTDKYGRVKVQFHWDRQGQHDENSSCFVRVAQIWAGPRFGAMHIPRIGQEVIVEFLEGDPDRPIITGRVYNEDNLPPYDLPQNQTQSGFKSRSSKGGTRENFNELRFEDKIGEEEVFLHAEKDLREQVKNEHHTQVGANQSNDVKKDQWETIGGEQALEVTGNRTVTVSSSQKVTIGGKGAVEGFTGSQVDVTGDYSLDTTQKIHIQAPMQIELVCGESSITITPTAIAIKAGQGAALELTTDVMLKAAQIAQLLMDATGTAVIEGTQVSLEGKGSAQAVCGASIVKADPTGITVTGAPMVRVN